MINVIGIVIRLIPPTANKMNAIFLFLKIMSNKQFDFIKAFMLFRTSEFSVRAKLFFNIAHSKKGSKLEQSVKQKVGRDSFD